MTTEVDSSDLKINVFKSHEKFFLEAIWLRYDLKNYLLNRKNNRDPASVAEPEPPEPYFLAGAEIISYFRLRLQKVPYKNDFITTIFFQIMVFS